MTSGQVVPAPVIEGRRLDWFPRFDEASRAFAVAPGATGLPARGRLWQPGKVLDQGQEGACCGFAAAAEAAAQPVPIPRVTNAYARGWYANAKRRDQWPGEAYDGTSVLATMKEGKARGVYGAYGWFFSAEQLAHGLVKDEKDDGGPAVAGVEWRFGSYATDAQGVLRPSGEKAGGHALCIFAVVVRADLTATDAAGVELRADLEELGLLDAVRTVLATEEAAFPTQNSWGLTYGRGGRFVAPLSVVRGWFTARGEFAQPQQRKLPATTRRTAMAEPEQEMDEASEDGTTTEHITAGEVQEGDRILDPPEELGQESATVRGVPQYVRGWSGRRVRIATTAGTITLGSAVPVTVRRPRQ